MTNISAPIEELKESVVAKAFEGTAIDMDALDFLGAFVLKRAIPPETIHTYAQAYLDGIADGALKKTDFHLTEVKLNEDQALRQILREPAFVDVASQFFGGQVGSDFVRIVKKDAQHTQAVFTHQDTGYQMGSFQRYSLFIALTDCNLGNGGLYVYPGTHHFGYLGDVGEIKNCLPSDYPKIQTTLNAGDILIMHSATWHGSPENTDKTNRVYLEVHIQAVDEPSTRTVICGERRSQWRLTLTEDDIFKNSRTQRLRGLYKQVEALQNAAKAQT